MPSEIPSRPWQTGSADLFYVQQSWFLIVVDYYSKFPFVRKLHNLTTRAIYAQDPVRKTWNPARVIDQGDTPRSYIIETEIGAKLRRNRIHLRPNNASNNLANKLSSCIPQGSIASQYSSANPQCSTLTETEKDPRKSRSGYEILAQERLNSDSCTSSYY